MRSAKESEEKVEYVEYETVTGKAISLWNSEGIEYEVSDMIKIRGEGRVKE